MKTFAGSFPRVSLRYTLGYFPIFPTGRTMMVWVRAFPTLSGETKKRVLRLYAMLNCLDTYQGHVRQGDLIFLFGWLCVLRGWYFGSKTFE